MVGGGGMVGNNNGIKKHDLSYWKVDIKRFRIHFSIECSIHQNEECYVIKQDAKARTRDFGSWAT